MEDDIQHLVNTLRPKFRAILRTRGIYTTRELLNQFKPHVWSKVEYHTAAIYHCSQILINKMDQIQRTFLHELQITDENAFLEFNFAPLNLRRDIALLGFLHKRVLGLAHPSFNSLFPFAPARSSRYPTRIEQHNKQLDDHNHIAQFREMLWKKSIFGLILVYNKLPQQYIDITNITDFQSLLTDHAREQCSFKSPRWRICLNRSYFVE